MSKYSLNALQQALQDKIGIDNYSDQIDRSLRLAYRGHEGQMRESSAEAGAPKVPYIVHPVGVALLAIELFSEAALTDKLDDIVSASLMHDLLEDTDVPVSEIEAASTKRAAGLVLSLTKPKLDNSLSRAERNQRFVGQIMASGKSAMFIKVCDLLHNLSRPNQSPIKLLEKAVSRGYGEHMALVDAGVFPWAIRERYLNGLQQAEQYLLAAKRLSGKATSAPNSLDEAVGVCIRKSESKVLEMHDIVQILSETTNALGCVVMGLDDYMRRMTAPGISIPQNVLAQIRANLSMGELDISKYEALRQSAFFKDASAVIAIPINFSVEGKNNIMFVSVGSEAPTWVTRNAVFVLLTVLSDRLKLQTSRHVVSMADQLRYFGLDIDPSLVIQSGISYENLSSLKSLLDTASYVHDRLLHILTLSMRDRKELHGIDKIESRVKSASSIVSKTHLRNIKSIEGIDDLVGFRFVCMSLKDTAVLAETLLGILTDIHGNDEYRLPIDQKSIQIDRATSVAGYNATHIKFLVREPHCTSAAIHCEIQIRTVFQDAWSRISHALRYKKIGKDALIDKVLAELSELRDAADTLVEKLR